MVKDLSPKKMEVENMLEKKINHTLHEKGGKTICFSDTTLKKVEMIIEMIGLFYFNT